MKWWCKSGPTLLWSGLAHAAKWRNPYLAAFLLWAMINKIRPARKKPPIRMLLLSKDGLREDVLVSIGRDPQFELSAIKMIELKPFKALASPFFPPEIDDNNYVNSSSEITNTKSEYRDFLRRIWKILNRWKRFDLVVTANFAYYAERELGAAFSDLGIPFVVMHKECAKSPGREKFLENLYKTRRGPFLGESILVYNEMERGIQVRAGICAEDKIILTGIPRLDAFHEWRVTGNGTKVHSHLPQLVFFSIDVRIALPIIARKSRSGFSAGHEDCDLGWWELSERCLEAMIEIARRVPHARVVIKTKRDHNSRKQIDRLCTGMLKLPENVDIAMGGDSFKLLAESRVVCGFNSTALLEALAVGTTVIVPRFAEATKEEFIPFVLDLNSAVEYANSTEALVTRACHHLTTPMEPKQKLSATEQRVLTKYGGNADGGAGKRVCFTLRKIAGFG